MNPTSPVRERKSIAVLCLVEKIPGRSFRTAFTFPHATALVHQLALVYPSQAYQIVQSNPFDFTSIPGGDGGTPDLEKALRMAITMSVGPQLNCEYLHVWVWRAQKSIPYTVAPVLMEFLRKHQIWLNFFSREQFSDSDIKLFNACLHDYELPDDPTTFELWPQQTCLNRMVAGLSGQRIPLRPLVLETFRSDPVSMQHILISTPEPPASISSPPAVDRRSPDVEIISRPPTFVDRPARPRAYVTSASFDRLRGVQRTLTPAARGRPSAAPASFLPVVYANPSLQKLRNISGRKRMDLIPAPQRPQSYPSPAPSPSDVPILSSSDALTRYPRHASEGQPSEPASVQPHRPLDAEVKRARMPRVAALPAHLKDAPTLSPVASYPVASYDFAPRPPKRAASPDADDASPDPKRVKTAGGEPTDRNRVQDAVPPPVIAFSEHAGAAVEPVAADDHTPQAEDWSWMGAQDELYDPSGVSDFPGVDSSQSEQEDGSLFSPPAPALSPLASNVTEAPWNDVPELPSATSMQGDQEDFDFLFNGEPLQPAAGEQQGQQRGDYAAWPGLFGKEVWD